MAVLQATADRLAADPAWSDEILGDPEVWGVETFTDRGIALRLVIKTQPASQFGVMRELRARITDAFADAGLTLAGAGRSDVWVHDADRPRSEPDRPRRTPRPTAAERSSSTGTSASPSRSSASAASADAPESATAGEEAADPGRHPRRGDPSETG